jgi:hypothetical protein
VDATELARLKIEYERQCYKKVEKTARDRLSLLQQAVNLEFDAVLVAEQTSWLLLDRVHEGAHLPCDARVGLAWGFKTSRQIGAPKFKG